MSFAGAKWVWMNGTLVPWKDANIHVSTHALHYGSGVFEGLRCYDTVEGPALFRISEHLERSCIRRAPTAWQFHLHHNFSSWMRPVCVARRWLDTVPCMLVESAS
jgi:hypothetical protein